MQCTKLSFVLKGSSCKQGDIKEAHKIHSGQILIPFLSLSSIQNYFEI